MAEDGATLRIDPHVHSDASYDGNDPVEVILEHAKEIGLDGVVVTDHDEIDSSLAAAALAADHDLVGIPGVEVSTAAGHLLAIGVEERPASGRSFAATVRRVRDLGGVAIVPHPFQRTRHGVRKRQLGDCDGIEGYNSMIFTGYRNRRARRFAERRGYPTVGASDAHSIRNLGRAYTEVHLPTVPAATPTTEIGADVVLEMLREGATAVRGRRTPINRSVRQYARGSIRKSGFAVTSRLPYVQPRPASLRDRSV